MRVLTEGIVDRTVVLFGFDADPDPELTWARGITLLVHDDVGELPHPTHPVAVIGWSVAGLNALAFAARRPDLVDRIVLTMNRLVIALVVSAGLVASSLLGIFATGGPEILGINSLSVVGFLVSGILGFWLLWGVLRSGRL